VVIVDAKCGYFTVGVGLVLDDGREIFDLKNRGA
jgi:hypothetical protein